MNICPAKLVTPPATMRAASECDAGQLRSPKKKEALTPITTPTQLLVKEIRKALVFCK